MDRQILNFNEIVSLIEAHNNYVDTLKYSFGLSGKIPFYLSSMIIEDVLCIVLESVIITKEEDNVLITYQTDKGKYINLLNKL